MPLSLGRQLSNTRASPRRLELAIAGVLFWTEENSTLQNRWLNVKWRGRKLRREGRKIKILIYLLCRICKQIRWLLWKQTGTLSCHISMFLGALHSAMFSILWIWASPTSFGLMQNSLWSLFSSLQHWMWESDSTGQNTQCTSICLNLLVPHSLTQSDFAFGSTH